MIYQSLYGATIVSLFWGVSNVLLKTGSNVLLKTATDDIRQPGLIAELRCLALSIRFLIPFLLNQLGSLLFHFLLSHSPMVLLVPCVNGMTVVITAVTSCLVGEGRATVAWPGLAVGTSLVMIGSTICLLSSEDRS